MHAAHKDAQTSAAGSEIDIVSKARNALKQGGIRFLTFPATLETAFNDYYSANTVTNLRAALWTGFFLYAVFGLVDLLLPPSDRWHMWFIRYAVVCPTVLAGITFTYARRWTRFRQPVIALVMLVGSLGIVAMVYFDPTPTKNYYYSGILLLIMGAFTFVSMRFLYAITWALATTVAYETVAVFANHTDPTILIQNTFSIVSTIIIGAFSNYLIEKYLRRDFLNSLLLEEENRELQRASHDLQRLSMSDPLTGLGNRRHFQVALEQEWKRAVRSEAPISLIIFDLDCFKAYNDNYGHQAGDDCLRRVAKKISMCARRAGDTSARYGGEEFVVLLSGTESSHAAMVAEEVRAAVEALGIEHPHSTVADVVTLSAGFATINPALDDKSGVLLVEAADEALYRAKRGGRNRVECTPPTERHREERPQMPQIPPAVSSEAPPARDGDDAQTTIAAQPS